jgi:adenosylhomocysteine nucleosidase
MSRPRIALVAAMEREVAPLVGRWKARDREFQGRRFRFFEADGAVLVCGGIGTEPARRATEAVIALYQPAAVQSVGFAGALDRGLDVGSILLPRAVIDAKDGSRMDTGASGGDLVSCDSVAGLDQKRRLAKAFGARAVDMEAASVARGAQACNLPFRAVKVISDGADESLPPLERFIGKDGRFRTGGMVWFAVLRPWLWPLLLRFRRNSRKAAEELCRWLHQNLAEGPEGATAEALVAGGQKA